MKGTGEKRRDTGEKRRDTGEKRRETGERGATRLEGERGSIAHPTGNLINIVNIEKAGE